MRHHFFSKNPKNQPTQKFEDGTLIRFYNIENYYRPKCICVFDIVFVFVFVYLSFCICFLFLGLYQDLGPEEPNTEPFAMDKEKFAIHFFLQFLMILNGFFWHGALGYISIFTVDAKKTHPFTFLYRLQLSSKANSLT